MTTKKLAIVLALVGWSASAAAQRKTVVDRIVAVVNDEVILESELVQRARTDPQAADIDEIADPREHQRRFRSLLRSTLQGMVDDELVLQAAKEAKLEVTDAEVTRAVEEVKRTNKLNDEQFEQALAQQGYTLEQYRKDVRKQVLRLRAVNVLVRPRVTVTEDEIKDRYEKMLGGSSAVTSVHLRHILVKLPPRPTPEEMDAARRKAGDIVSRAKAGEKFEDLARQFSDHEPTRDNGGALGWFERGSLPTEWEEIVFGMSEGEIRGPVRGPQGLHVLQVTETKKEAHRPFQEVKEQLRQQIFAEEMDKQTKVWLEELRKKAHVEIKL